MGQTTLVLENKEILLVKNCILMLSPVMSSMSSFFHTPVVSGVHWMVQGEPSLKTAPGLGARGTGSAKATNRVDKIKVRRAGRDNMTKGGNKKKSENNEKRKVKGEYLRE